MNYGRALRRGMGTTLAAFLLCFCWYGPALAQTDKLTISTPAGSIYSVDVPGGYQAKRHADGTVTARVLLTLHFIDVPDCYEIVSTQRATSVPYGILGPEMGGAETDRPIADLKNDSGLIVRADPPLTAREKLHNEIRNHVPRASSAGSMAGFNTLLAGAVEGAGEPARIKDPAMVFAFGDVLTNSRRARKVAYYGINEITLERFPNLGALKGVRLLADPNRAAETNLGTKDFGKLVPENFRNYGRWYFDLHRVRPRDRWVALPENTGMVSVKVTWALEATFDPENPPKFPLINPAFAPGKSDVAVPGTASVASGENQPAATPQQPAAAANAIAQWLGVQVSALTPLGGSTTVIPGLEFVAGKVVQNTGTASLIGLDVDLKEVLRRRETTDKKPAVGLMVGQSDGDEGALIGALSLRLHPAVTAFGGLTFKQVQGNLRTGPAIGVALSLSRLLAPPPAPSEKNLDVEVADGSSSGRPRCLKDTQAAMVWTGPDTPSLADRFVAQVEQQQNNTPKTFSIEVSTEEGKVWLAWAEAGTLRVDAIKHQTRPAQPANGPWTDAQGNYMAEIVGADPKTEKLVNNWLVPGKVYRLHIKAGPATAADDTPPAPAPGAPN